MNTVQVENPNGNIFDLGHPVKQTLDMGFLVPFLVQDTLPGDKFTIGAEIVARFQALMAPTMHKFNIYTHYFYTPNRILWDGWPDFIKSVNNSEDAPAHPYFSGVHPSSNGLPNYLGLPVYADDAGIDKVSCLPFMAYNKIWNEYYRDQNLQEELVDKAIDGLNPQTHVALQRRAWQHDYFTSALPNAQKGMPVTIPLGTSAPIKVANPSHVLTNAWKYSSDNVNVAGSGSSTAAVNVNGVGQTVSGSLATRPNVPMYLDLAAGGYSVDLSSATQVDVNTLRTAFRVQEWLERAARVGTRYTEVIRGFYGVTVPDATLQRPLYLGGSKQPMVISEVLQTSETTDTSPQGDMAGHGIAIGGGNAFSYRCTEHGYIIGLMSILPDTNYQQGIEPHWSKFDPVQYGWPQFANLGEQPVLNREVFYANDGQNDDTFGYMPIYGEYRVRNGRVAGDFTGTLAYWHDGRIFQDRPRLNAQFVACDPSDRIFTVSGSNGSQVLSYIYNHVRVYRLLPKFGTPKLI